MSFTIEIHITLVVGKKIAILYYWVELAWLEEKAIEQWLVLFIIPILVVVFIELIFSSKRRRWCSKIKKIVDVYDHSRYCGQWLLQISPSFLLRAKTWSLLCYDEVFLLSAYLRWWAELFVAMLLPALRLVALFLRPQAMEEANRAYYNSSNARCRVPIYIQLCAVMVIMQSRHWRA